jgi:uracil DNA glycosylase/ribonuclease HI
MSINYIHRAIKNINPLWIPLLINDVKTEELLLNILLKQNNKSIPHISKIFEFTRWTHPEKIQIVILGHQPEKGSHGLSYSNREYIPADILDALTESKNIILENKIKENTLIGWAQQGVLLLNSYLTLECEDWNAYTNILIQNISNYYRQKKQKLIFVTLNQSQYINPYHDILNLNWKNIFKINTIKWENYMTDLQYLCAYTDGSCINNGTQKAKGGFAIAFTYPINFNNLIIYGRLDDQIKPTNIRAEGEALYNLFNLINEIQIVNYIIHVKTDSEFWFNMLYEFIPNWISKNIKLETKKNADLVKKLWQSYNLVLKNNYICLEHLYSHNNEYLNSTEVDIIQDYIMNQKVDDYAKKALDLEPGIIHQT